MRPLRCVTSVAIPMWIEDLDTDQIIPGRFCVRPAGEPFGDALFAARRYRDDGSEAPGFILNREPYRTAQILVTGPNVGYGSAREHAAWAVRDFGIRVVIAPSIATIFAGNCVRSGVLPVALGLEEVSAIIEEISAVPTELTVDLARQTVTAPSGRTFAFAVGALDRELLLGGVDAIVLVRGLDDEVAAFGRIDRVRRPWVYDTVTRPASTDSTPRSDASGSPTGTTR